MNILVATLQDGDSFVLTETWTRERLRELRKKERFFCPQCKQPLLLKIGHINIPHFAHQPNTTCPHSFSEGETLEHLRGKQHLYTLFTRQQLPTTLEPYLSTLAQRPDLLVTYQGQSIPIEFQHSRIPISTIIKRTRNYKAHRLQPIWILHTPSKMKKLPQGITPYSLSTFDQQFIRSTPQHETYMMTYNVNTKTFHYVSHLFHIEKYKYIVNHRILSFQQQRFPFFIPKALNQEEISSYIQHFIYQRTQFLKNRLRFNRKGVQDRFLRSCYELRIIPTLMPWWIGVPIDIDDGFFQHACEWQMGYLKWRNEIEIREMSDLSLIKRAICSIDSPITNEARAIQSVQQYEAFLNLIELENAEQLHAYIKQKKISVLLSEYLQKERNTEKI